MKQTYLNHRILLAALIIIIMPFPVVAQMSVAKWIGYNSYTDIFPIAASATSPAVVGSATLEFNGLTRIDDAGSAWKNEHEGNDLSSAPFQSFTINLLSTVVTFDKFVLNGLALENKSTIVQLRWSIDNFKTSLGKFTAGESFQPALTSVDLSAQRPYTGRQVEFRLYYSNGKGMAIHSDAGKYTSLDGTADSYGGHNEFASVWVKDATVPAAIEQFRGRVEDNTVQLKWHTSSEQNISHFEIERSIDGETFYNAGKVSALGIPAAVNKYHFTDRVVSAAATTLFYRLWMLDNKGTASYTPTIAVIVNKNEAGIFVYPNPVNDIATLVINSPKEETIRYSIIDSKSRKILTGRHAIQQGSNAIRLALSSLSRGSYTLQVKGGSIESSVQFVK